MFIASAASQPIAGVLLDRFGPVIAVTYLAPLAIVGMVLFAWSESVTGLTFGRILIGAGFSCVVTAFISSCSAGSNRRTSQPQRPPSRQYRVHSRTDRLPPLAYGLATFGRGPVFMTLAVTSAVVIVLVAFSVKEGPLSDRAKRPNSPCGKASAALARSCEPQLYLVGAVQPDGPRTGFQRHRALSGVYLRERLHWTL